MLAAPSTMDEPVFLGHRDAPCYVLLVLQAKARRAQGSVVEILDVPLEHLPISTAILLEKDCR